MCVCEAPKSLYVCEDDDEGFKKVAEAKVIIRLERDWRDRLRRLRGTDNSTMRGYELF